jgi:hypothetical protein
VLERARRFRRTIGAGGHFSDNGDNALVFEMSLPLPPDAAPPTEREAQAGDEAEAARGKRGAHWRTRPCAYVRRATATALADTVLPDARRTVTEPGCSARAGCIRELLLARRALIEIEREHLDALNAFTWPRSTWSG